MRPFVIITKLPFVRDGGGLNEYRHWGTVAQTRKLMGNARFHFGIPFEKAHYIVAFNDEEALEIDLLYVDEEGYRQLPK